MNPTLSPKDPATLPLVSILIPAYKPRWFRQALVSALNQTYINTEILVFDNCPDESIHQICQDYPQVVYRRNPNRGYQNVEDLLIASKGRYIKYLFDDDLLEPNCVAELVAAIRKHPDVYLAFGVSWEIDENDKRLRLRQTVETPDRIHLYDGNSFCRHLARNCANMIGEFSSVLLDGIWLRENPKRLIEGIESGRHFQGLTDVICFMNAAAGRSVAFVNASLTSFRLNSESNSNPDKNPGYIHAITDWRQIIAEAQALGVLTDEDTGIAKNSYNHLATSLASGLPKLATAIFPTCFPENELPGYPKYMESRTLRSAGQESKAIALLMHLAENKACFWKIYDDLGDFAHQQGDEQLALQYYRAATCKAVTPVVEGLKYARLFLKFGLRHEAELLLRRFLEAFPDNSDAMHLLNDCRTDPSAPDQTHGTQNADSQPEDIGEPIQALQEPGAITLASYAGTPVKGNYNHWIDIKTLDEQDARIFQEHAGRLWKKRILFEFILVLEPGSEALLADSIDSIAQQYYDGWLLTILAHGPSPEAEFTREGATVQWVQLPDKANIAEIIDKRLAQTPADWIGFFTCGTRFTPQQLLVLADYIAIHPEWRLIYSDEDAIDAEQQRRDPQFKPDFNLELLRSTDYIGGIFVDRKALLSAGGYSRIRGAESYDTILRIADADHDEKHIGHIADILCHTPPAHPGRAEEGGAVQALQEHFARRKIEAEIEQGNLEGITRRILYRHLETPKVSIIVPTRNRLELLGPCVESLLKNTRYPDWELLIVDNGSDDANVTAYYETLCSTLPNKVRLLRYDAPFNYSAMNNLAARNARGDYLLLLNNDTECIHDDWLDAMMAHAQRPEVGIVGARLLFPDSLKVQHAGVILGMAGTAGHVSVNSLFHDEPGYLNRAQVDQECSAVTGACLLIRKALFEKLEGLDENDFSVSFNDIDLCLRLRDNGHRIVWTPFATLLHHGSATQLDSTDPQKRSAFQMEGKQFYLRWEKEIASDPAWNRNLSISNTDPTVEDDLVVRWNTDFRDRPRILVMPSMSQGIAEYRNLAPLRALHAEGRIQYASVCQPRKDYERAPMPTELKRLAPDTLFMNTPVDNLRCQALLSYQHFNSDTFRVYTLDDLITDLPAWNPNHRTLPADVMKERLALGLKASHRLIVSTEPLAEAYRHLIDDIRIVPNSLPWQLWGHLQPQRRRGKKMRVGWAGAQQHASDLQLVQEVVKATHKEVDWIFFGMLLEEMRPYVAEFHDFVHDFFAYPAKLASLDLDLAIAPLETHPFNEAKSNLRLLEYGVLGWPVICTDIFPYRTDNPPVTRLPNDPAKWIAAIREKVAEPEALAHEGSALHEWVKQHYLLKNRMDQWLSALTR